ncbi:uncharacterized protein SOCEGT47_074870 [Sorangium cellulosum]|uniref:Uncharacterized protein n=1 Tax=Sorangium cellulosum TaxID=56 RepID=A0A4P2QB65_SORCE|nr:uncharacterized protein SOCEGT47_074870 [Sorangium cellulosum]
MPGQDRARGQSPGGAEALLRLDAAAVLVVATPDAGASGARASRWPFEAVDGGAPRHRRRRRCGDLVCLEEDVRQHLIEGQHHGDAAAGAVVAARRAVAVRAVRRPVLTFLRGGRRQRRVIASDGHAERLEGVALSQQTDDEEHRKHGADPAKDRAASTVGSPDAEHPPRAWRRTGRASRSAHWAASASSKMLIVIPRIPARPSSTRSSTPGHVRRPAHGETTCSRMPGRLKGGETRELEPRRRGGRRGACTDVLLTCPGAPSSRRPRGAAGRAACRRTPRGEGGA